MRKSTIDFMYSLVMAGTALFRTIGFFRRLLLSLLQIGFVFLPFVAADYVIATSTPDIITYVLAGLAWLFFGVISAAALEFFRFFDEE